MKSEWTKVSKSNPCPICGKGDWCKVSADGAVALCGRIEQSSFQSVKGGQGWLHRLTESPRPDSNGSGRMPPRKANSEATAPMAAPSRDWQDEYDRLAAAMTDDRLAALAESTGLPVPAWRELSPGWAEPDDLRRLRAGGDGWADNPPDGAYVFGERCGEGRVVGLSLRAPDGRKGFCGGGKRGLTLPNNPHALPDPMLIVEGASDVAACRAVGLAAVGRPSNRGGAADVSHLADGRAALVVGERDGKPGGAWPGRDGAKAVAEALAGKWGEPVAWTLPPDDAKDIRAWLTAKLAGGLDASDADAMKAAGRELLAALRESAKPVKPQKRTQADALVDLAQRHYRLGLSDERKAFAVPVDGPAVAMMFRGGASALRATLARHYRQQTGKTPSASALADAMTALEGMAQDAEPEPVALRVAAYDGGIVLDLADASGAAVVVTADGWRVVEQSPVLFRRTALTAALPTPEPADPADLLELRRLLNVDDDTWPVLVGWLVAAMLPDIPHAVLLLGGEHGTGKSSAARMLVGLIDPSAALLRSEPRDAEQWAIAAWGSWMICLDNISHIPAWLSDALCKAVTGDGLVRRKLYSDADLAVLSFKRCIILTSIDPGAMRGDLGDRLLLADLKPIPDELRRTEAELDAAYRAMLPRLFGALLSAVAATLAALPDVRLRTMPRMADFARVLAALDTACPELTGGRALDLFAGQRRRIAGEVVESDPVGLAVLGLMANRDEWKGTASELLAAISPPTPLKGWPRNARALAGRLRRLRPALMQVGIAHYPPGASDKTRTHRIEKGRIRPPEPPESGDSNAPAGICDGRYEGGTDDLTARPPVNRPTARPTANGVFDPVKADSGGVGGMGGTNPLISMPANVGLPDAPSVAPNGRERGEL